MEYEVPEQILGGKTMTPWKNFQRTDANLLQFMTS